MGHGILRFHPTFAAQESLEKNTILYHIFPLNQFQKTIEQKKVFFRRVIDWPDTYEYPIRAMPEDRRELIEKCLFGFCFAQTCDKEAMWKLYSYDDHKHGVCIQTTVASFCQSLGHFTDKDFTNVFIGKVKYAPYLESDPSCMFYEQDKTQYPDYMFPAYLKRDCFSYEDEVRLLLFDTDFREIPHHLIDIRSFSFIHSIILSPYFPDEDIHNLKKLCTEHSINVNIQRTDLFRNIKENSAELPPESELYWGAPKNAYKILDT